MLEGSGVAFLHGASLCRRTVPTGYLRVSGVGGRRTVPTFESPESVVAALFLPSSLRSLWSPHCSYLRVSMYHNGVASSRPPGASLRIARHSILVVVLPFRSQQEEPRDESFPCHSEVSVRYRTRSSRFFPAVLGQARPPFDLGRCRCLAVFLRPQASSLKPQGGA